MVTLKIYQNYLLDDMLSAYNLLFLQADFYRD
jgi:hypothetical protein